MPKIYLATPAGSGEEYPNGGDEFYWINKIADSTEKKLTETDVTVCRSKIGMGESGKVNAANREQCEIYLAIASHKAPKEAAATLKGLDVCYFEPSEESRCAAEIFAEELRKIYPEPDLAGARPSEHYGELENADSPAVAVFLAYHDNPQDEAWLVNSVESIAEALAKAAVKAMEANSETA